MGLGDIGRSRRIRGTTWGQALAEFVLVFPIFFLLLVGLIEFAFTFNAVLAVNFATRDAALVAAEAGTNTGADCSILQQIERDIGPPAEKTQILEVRIYWSDVNGATIGSNVDIYSRKGTLACPGGSVPYTPSSLAYPPSARCAVIAGCGGKHTGLDTIGVQVTYQHTWRTPFPQWVGGSGSGPTIVKSNAMRLEPVL
jgi:hypothetical protein